MSRPRVQALLFVAASILLTLPHSPAAAGASQPDDVIHVYFSAGCTDCWPYVEDILLPSLQAGGVEAASEIHDYTLPAERTRLMERADDIELPRSIADSLYAFVPMGNRTLIVLGHVPPAIIGQVLEHSELPQRLVVWQPEMHGEPKEYRLWAWAGDVTTFDIDTPFEQALQDSLNAAGPLPVGLANLSELLPAVVVTGLLDSVNPCAFAVILLLLAFLFTIRQSRRRILQLGLIYIGMIFLVYFAIGLGILRAVRFSEDPHFVARAGAFILIALGSINLAEYFFPNFPIKLHLPAAAGDKTNEWLKQATVPATVGVGVLVGLCTFPCSGGVYVSIITLLNAKTTLAWGVSYLALYNVLFVLPLMVILLAAGNRMVAKRWAGWERENSVRIRLWYGLAMVALGVVMLVWVIG
jgi:cytochrome c biogenesis protein CcdA